MVFSYMLKEQKKVHKMNDGVVPLAIHRQLIGLHSQKYDLMLTQLQPAISSEEVKVPNL